MEDNKSLYIRGEPIETDLGEIYFIKMNQYTEFMKYMPYLHLYKFEIVNFFKKSEHEQFREFGELLDEMFLIDIIKCTIGVLDLFQSFTELFKICFKKDVFYLINTDEELEKYLSLIRDMNCVVKEEKNPNPEIQRFNDLKKIYNQRKNSNITFESIYTSVWLSTKTNPEELTIYQFYALFNRIGQFKSFDVTTLYSTVSKDVKIINWSSHVDMFAKEKHTTLEEFSKDAKSILGNK